MIQLLVAGLTVGSTYALVALGIHIILRATRAINFAQGDFVVLGGLFALSFVSQLHVNIWVALLGSTALGFVLGALYERFILRAAARVNEGAVMIASIGTVYVLLYGHALIWGNEPQPLPTFSSAQQVQLGGATIAVQSIWVIALLAVMLAVLYVFFERTVYGKAIRAAANDPIGARLAGINVDRARSVSAAISIALATFAGTIVGPITLVGGSNGITITVKGFVGAILGGLASPIGCTAGGLLVGLIETLLGSRFAHDLVDPLVYAILLVVLLVRPQGLFGGRRIVRD
ncbi:MAG TPA: branched-chain amino acid ABC transporter permease [Candidatus Lustribacter sp.]|nr:branched-chain amino acid ABC transporter permease [Candidatus Lustribacter sp.]